ncbi:MAG TPA: T9SS type A sorting domain-containing protein [Cyclobacteriaceae bacterium]
MRPLNLIFLLVFVLSSVVSYAQGSEVAIPEKVIDAKSVSIYPNPATEFVNIKLADLQAHKAKVALYNILGNEIPAETEIVDDHEIRIRVKELSTGYYLIAVHEEQAKFRGTYKFLKR